MTLRISGIFRDAFPGQIDLIDSAVRAVAALDEDETANPIAAAVRASREQLLAAGIDPRLATIAVGDRIFGSKPGAYGAGLQALIDEGLWESRADLAEALLAWGGYAYGGGQRRRRRPRAVRRSGSPRSTRSSTTRTTASTISSTATTTTSSRAGSRRRSKTLTGKRAARLSQRPFAPRDGR